jgi:hypothetical protein
MYQTVPRDAKNGYQQGRDSLSNNGLTVQAGCGNY